MNDILSEENSMLELQVDPASADYIESAGWWAMFSSIVCAILILLIVIVAGYLFYMGFETTLQMGFGRDNLASFIWLAVALVVAFCGLMFGLLISFGMKVRRGIEQYDQEKLEGAFATLKTYFIIYGILSIIGALGTLMSVLK